MKPLKMLITAAGLAGALMAGLASAQEKSDRSVHSLYHVCQAETDQPTSFCKAYLMGVADTLSAFGAGGHKAGLCAATYDPRALERIYLAWVPQHRELWDLDMFAGVQAALRERWPCV